MTPLPADSSRLGTDGATDPVPVDFAELLTQRREQLESGRDKAESQLAGIRAERADAHDDDEHDPEGSTLSTEWSRAEGLRGETAREIDEIVAAQARWDAGTFGVCESCGAQIPVERLRVRPAARRCVACASRLG